LAEISAPGDRRKMSEIGGSSMENVTSPEDHISVYDIEVEVTNSTNSFDHCSVRIVLVVS
jgi:hypothetical protein